MKGVNREQVFMWTDVLATTFGAEAAAMSYHCATPPIPSPTTVLNAMIQK